MIYSESSITALSKTICCEWRGKTDKIKRSRNLLSTVDYKLMVIRPVPDACRPTVYNGYPKYAFIANSRLLAVQEW